jgi:hypothetical protein
MSLKTISEKFIKYSFDVYVNDITGCFGFSLSYSVLNIRQPSVF